MLIVFKHINLNFQANHKIKPEDLKFGFERSNSKISQLEAVHRQHEPVINYEKNDHYDGNNTKDKQILDISESAEYESKQNVNKRLKANSNSP